MDSTNAFVPSAALASRPQGNVHWFRLLLSHLYIGDDGANVIADMLQNSHLWQIFDLAHVPLDDTGIKALVEAVKSKCDWRCVNVARTKKVDKHGVRKFGRVGW